MEGPVERQGRGVDGEGDVRDVQANAVHRHGAHRRRVDPAGRKPLAPKGAVRFRSSSTPPSAPDAPAAGKGAGGGYPHDDALCKWTAKRAGKCADYDWGYRQGELHLGPDELAAVQLPQLHRLRGVGHRPVVVVVPFSPDRGHARD